jgi:hypothetical protein
MVKKKIPILNFCQLILSLNTSIAIIIMENPKRVVEKDSIARSINTPIIVIEILISII